MADDLGAASPGSGGSADTPGPGAAGSPHHQARDLGLGRDALAPSVSAVLDGYFWERRRRSAVLPIAVGVIGLTAIGLVQGVPVRHQVEQDLTTRSALALREAGVDGISVRFSGRDATVSGAVTSAAQHDSALAAVRHVTGVRVAHDRISRTAANPPAAKTAPQVSVELADGRLALSGTVGTAAARAGLVAAARDALQADRVSSRLSVDSKVSDTGLDRLADVLSALGPDGAVTVELSGGRITLTGTVSSSGRAGQALAAAAALTGDPQRVVDRLTVDDGAAVTAALRTLDAITFRTGYSTPSRADEVIIARVAAILRDHSSVRVQVCGFTDDVGPADLNDRLSVARAQAVLRQLVRTGVDPSRLTPAGFGERDPRLPNTSPENRAANRRVEFRLLPGA
ncbi:MAG TPA: OmpA family protein [Kineosporiaceae bacterium]|nr:OmpA family protein [Kineosporiaceae bacterium]